MWSISLLALLALLVVSDALPPFNMGNETLSRGRYAVLRTSMLGGNKNVRWETRPMQYVGENGKPMHSTPTKGLGCVDSGGKTQASGAEYERPSGKFKYRCVDGQEEVVACVGSNRTSKARIEVGKTLEVNGFWHKCESFPNGSVVYTQATACNYADKEYRVGEIINAGFLQLECQAQGYKVVGCYYLDENQTPVAMKSGEKKEAGKVVHYCEEQGDNLQYFAKATGCTKAGKDYKEGDTFSQNHLHYKCTNGITDITGCFVDEKKDLAIGADLVESNMVYRCYRLGGKIEYTEYACGQNGTPSCKPEPIPQTPDDVPQLARGLKAPGFGTFAIVQRVGGSDLAANPGDLKLELDKLLASHH